MSNVEAPKRLTTQIDLNSSFNRNFPARESSTALQTYYPDFRKEAAAIDKIRRSFRQGGVEVVRPGVRTNYDISVALWNAKRAEAVSEIVPFKKEETAEVEKVLRERYGSAESVITYIIDDDYRLRNDKYPNETAAVRYHRGNLFLEREGSVDTTREQAEFQGFLKVENLLADPTTPLKTKMMVMSPPSSREGTFYVNNFVDFYELLEDKGQRKVKMTRFATTATYDEGVTDVYLLSHPIRIDSGEGRSVYEIFNQKFSPEKKALEEGKMQEILRESKERIKFYVYTLTNPQTSAENIAVAFNAILNGADIVWRRLKGLVARVTEGASRVFRNIQEEVSYLGRQKVEEFMAACGVSAGFSVGRGLRGLGSFLTKNIRGILKRFSGTDSKGELDFDCPGCGATHTRPRGGTIPSCDNCGKNLEC